MFNNKPIILEGYGAAVFLAQMEFKDDEYVPSYMRFKSKDNRDGSTRFEINPDYPYKSKEEERKARHKHEQRNREFVLNYLKDNYPDNDYAERYDKDNKWNKPLREHNTETRNCEFLEEDGRHCRKERLETTCYTCCFNCTLPPDGCNKGNCNFIEK